MCARLCESPSMQETALGQNNLVLQFKATQAMPIFPLYTQIKEDVDANMFKEFISSQIAKLRKGLNKSDFRLVYQTLIELNEMQKELSDIMPEKIELIEEKILAEMIQSKEIFTMSEQMKLFTITGGIEEVASLMEFRIKRHFVDEPQIDKMTIEEAVSALNLLQEYGFGKVDLHIEMYNIIKKLAGLNKDEILSIQSAKLLLESIVVNQGGRLYTNLEKKIEQSVRHHMKQNFNMKDLILIGHYLSLGCEGEHSFWTYFEDSVISHSSQLTSQSLIVVLEALQRRVRRSVSVWTALESELEPMIPQLSPDELIRVIRIFNAFKKEHTLWPSFNDAICSYEQLSKEQVYEIMKLCHEDDRKRRVWVHFLEKFLIKRGYFLQYSYQELKLIESWIKASGKMNSEAEATFGLLYKVKNPKIKE